MKTAQNLVVTFLSIVNTRLAPMRDHLDLNTYKQLAEQLQSLTESEANLHAFIVGHFEELSYYGIIDLAQRGSTADPNVT